VRSLVVVRRRLGPRVDVWSCNEEELQEHLRRRIDLLDPQVVLDAVRDLHASVGAETLVVHTQRWALALGGAEPLRRALLHQSSDEHAESMVTKQPNGGLVKLSRAERRVTALAATGHTNREIAQKLYITVSTVACAPM
jgi:DNA-binding NarL/FixJ family response regulator